MCGTGEFYDYELCSRFVYGIFVLGIGAITGSEGSLILYQTISMVLNPVVNAGGGGGGPKKRRQHNPCDDTDDVDFVKSNLDDAQILADKLGVPVQWVLAVAASESKYGTYPTAQKANNYFGIHAGSVAVANGSTGPYSRNPIFAAWAPGTDGFLGSGNAMVSFALSDGAKGVSNASTFFTDIHAQFGVGNANYVSDMQRVLRGVTARLNCP